MMTDIFVCKKIIGMVRKIVSIFDFYSTERVFFSYWSVCLIIRL